MFANGCQGYWLSYYNLLHKILGAFFSTQLQPSRHLLESKPSIKCCHIDKHLGLASIGSSSLEYGVIKTSLLAQTHNLTSSGEGRQGRWYYTITFLNRCFGLVRIKEQIPQKTHVYKRSYQVHCASFTYNSTLNSAHNWKDLCLQLRKPTNMHLRTPYLNHRTSNVAVQFVLRLHHRFANETQVSLCKSNLQKLGNMKKEPNNNHIPYYVLSCGTNRQHMS